MKLERLQQIYCAELRVDELRDKIAQLETMRVSPRSAAYGSERVQSSTKGDITERNLEKIETLLKNYNKELTFYLNLITEYENALLNLKEREKVIIDKHYRKGKSWNIISEEMDISERQVRRIKGKALKQICEKKSETCP
jgi:DNA-directed RNA polymerase specialized sigma subunit